MQPKLSIPGIIAHRGGGNLAPENTLAAFQCGYACGFRAVEFDVMLSKDGVPVVIHDEQLGRTVAGSGLVCELDAAQLLDLDAGSWFGAEFAAARVPRFIEVLEYCTARDIWMNIEIKPARGHEIKTAGCVAAMTHEFYQNANFPAPLFSSFSMLALEAAQRVAPDIPRGALFDRVPHDWQRQTDSLQAVSLHTNQRYLEPALVAQIHQAGLQLCCYTVNQPERARELLRWGVDAIFTDNLQQIGADFA